MPFTHFVMANDSSPTHPPHWLEIVRKQVEAVQFGTVQLTVHEGQVVQVERVERVRLDPRQRIPAKTRLATTAPSTTHGG
jgi:hypothetical protein